MWGVWELLRPVVVLLYVYIPGLLLVQWALSEASRLTRISVAAGVSPILLGWLLIVESLLGIEVSIGAVLGGLLLMDLALAGMVLWRNPQGFRRPWLRIREVALRLQHRLRTFSPARRQTSFANVAMVAMAVVVMPLSSTYMTRITKEGFTEFSIVEQEPDVALWRRAVPLDEPVSITVELRSTERAPAQFSVHLAADDSAIGTVDLGQFELGIVEPGDHLVRNIPLPPRTDKVQRFVVTLLKDDEIDEIDPTPYRTLFFWISTSVAR